MVQKNRTDWGNVRVPQEMLDLIAKYLETDVAKQKGLKGLSDVAVLSIRQLLEREGMYPLRPRLEHLNMYEDHVKVIDNVVDRISSVYFQKGGVYCDLCATDECIHTDFALALESVQQKLKERGFKPRKRTS